MEVLRLEHQNILLQQDQTIEHISETKHGSHHILLTRGIYNEQEKLDL